MSDVFKALADPTRREILLIIAEEHKSINALAERFSMSRTAVAKHIKILEASKLTRIEQDKHDGRQRNCFAQLEALEEVNDYLKKLEGFWNDKLDGLSGYLSRVKGDPT